MSAATMQYERASGVTGGEDGMNGAVGVSGLAGG